jgi:hypothetical protein
MRALTWHDCSREVIIVAAYVVTCERTARDLLTISQCLGNAPGYGQPCIACARTEQDIQACTVMVKHFRRFGSPAREWLSRAFKLEVSDTPGEGSHKVQIIDCPYCLDRFGFILFHKSRKPGGVTNAFPVSRIDPGYSSHASYIPSNRTHLLCAETRALWGPDLGSTWDIVFGYGAWTDPYWAMERSRTMKNTQIASWRLTTVLGSVARWDVMYPGDPKKAKAVMERTQALLSPQERDMLRAGWEANMLVTDKTVLRTLRFVKDSHVCSFDDIRWCLLEDGWRWHEKGDRLAEIASMVREMRTQGLVEAEGSRLLFRLFLHGNVKLTPKGEAYLLGDH